LVWPSAIVKRGSLAFFTWVTNVGSRPTVGRPTVDRPPFSRRTMIRWRESVEPLASGSYNYYYCKLATPEASITYYETVGTMLACDIHAFIQL
jgi:hypothetical protein